MDRAPGRRRTLALAVAALVAVAAIVGLIVFYPADWPGFAPPSPVTVQGRDTEGIYRFVFTIAAVIFLLVEGLILFAVLRYRRTDDTLPAQTHGNLFAEAAWTIVPAIIVISLFFLSINVQNKVEARSPNPDVTIDVVGFQWQWTIAYGCPASYATQPTVQPADECDFAITGLGSDGPDMHVPVGQTIHFRLHSADVIHAFYIPQFLYKKDVIPGRVNGFDVIVEQPGTYQGQCAELCGLSHAEMFMSLTAEDSAAYDDLVRGAGRDRQRDPDAGAEHVRRPAAGRRHRPGQRLQRGRLRPDAADRAGQRAHHHPVRQRRPQRHAQFLDQGRTARWQGLRRPAAGRGQHEGRVPGAAVGGRHVYVLLQLSTPT